MNFTININYLLIISIFATEFLVDSFTFLPKILKWVTEILIVILAINLLLRFAIIKKTNLHKSLLAILFLFSLNIIIGLIINGGNPLNIIIGIRNHLKFVPLLLLPAVYNFSEDEIKKTISLILMFLLIQLPVTIYQRFYQFRGISTGDVITGTVGESSLLSIILIMGISIVFAFYLSKRISLPLMFTLTVILFIPTTINETKGTLVLFPFAIFTPIVILIRDKRLAFSKFLAVTIIATLSLVSFIPIYNMVLKERFETGLIEKYSDKKEIRNYFFRASRYETDDVRRGDSIVFAYKELTKNGIDLITGKGIGNVARTIFDKSNKLKEKYKQMGAEVHTLSIITWETGILGLFLYLYLYYIGFQAAFKLKMDNGFFGNFALGWCSVNIIFLLSLIYKNILQFNTLNILFWFFSGIVISKNIESQNKSAHN